MRFTKMQGLGNDYLYVYGEVPHNAADLSRALSDRHFGAGSDGMIFISPSDRADFKMRVFNADGSEARMCGNGIRCVGKYVYDKGLTDKSRLTIETLSGIKQLQLHLRKNHVESVTVSMGSFLVSEDMYVCVDGEQVVLTPVSVGNPHAVIFTESIEDSPVSRIGAKLERHKAFPDGVNVEFVQVVGRNKLRMKVWERGSGITLACGTGACACAAASVSKEYCGVEDEITVQLDGGTLKIRVQADGTVTMTGPCETVYEGESQLC